MLKQPPLLRRLANSTRCIPISVLQLASVYRHLGRSQDAEEQHVAHRHIEPHVAEIEHLRTLAQPGRNPSAHFNLARLYARLGHDAGAVRHLRTGLSSSRTTPELGKPRQCPHPLGSPARRFQRTAKP